MKEKLNRVYLKYPSIEDINMLDEYVEEYKEMFPKYHAVSKENYEEYLKSGKNIEKVLVQTE